MGSYKFKTKPYPYQLKVLKLAIKKKRFALWLDPGLGKTKISIDFCGYYNRKKDLQRVLVICPKSVKGVWLEEIETHLPKDCDIEWKITTYQYLVLHEKEFAKWKPQAVIIDESHYIKSHTAKRSKTVKRICKNAEYQLQLTGTPQPNNYLDLWNQIDTISPGVLGKWGEFKERHAVYDYFGFKVIKWLNLDELRSNIRPFRVRVKKEQILDLPPKVFQNIPVELDHKQQELYNKIKADAFARLDETSTVTADIVLVQLLRLQQITGGFTVVEDEEGNKTIKDVGDAKLKALEELLPTYTTTGKVVIFCRFLHELKQIYKVCTKLKLNPLYIKGGMSDNARDTARRSFQSDKKHRVIICQVKAGGVGITLHAANTAIFYSLTYGYDEYMQACDRIHRIGQKAKSVQYLHLVARGTVDGEILKALQLKKSLTEVITDNWKEILK